MSLSDVDKVRLEIGDTDASEELLSDTQITAFLDDRSLVDTTGATIGVNLPAAAADAAGAISAKYARQFDFSEDGQSFALAQRVGHFQALEKTLRARSGGASVRVQAGGTESVT